MKAFGYVDGRHSTELIFRPGEPILHDLRAQSFTLSVSDMAWLMDLSPDELHRYIRYLASQMGVGDWR